MNRLIIVIILYISSYSLYSQDRIIKGRIISEDFETLAGIIIKINDTIKIGTTDIDGFFEISLPYSQNKISFDMVGIEPTTIEVLNDCDQIELVMMYIYTYDFKSLKCAERKRKKRFSKLKIIHERAVDRELFKNKNTCYSRSFTPFYLE